MQNALTWPWGVDQVGAVQVPAPLQSWGQEGVGWVLPPSERTLHIKREPYCWDEQNIHGLKYSRIELTHDWILFPDNRSGELQTMLVKRLASLGIHAHCLT
jgi:hypothetical protein